MSMTRCAAPTASPVCAVRSVIEGSVSADGKGLVSQAGALLLAETLRINGLGESLSAGLARRRAPRAIHDPG
jgi:hypothetical protein